MAPTTPFGGWMDEAPHRDVVMSRQGAAHRETDQGGFLYSPCANKGIVSPILIGELW
jgi:hypothetical protein